MVLQERAKEYAEERTRKLDRGSNRKRNHSWFDGLISWWEGGNYRVLSYEQMGCYRTVSRTDPNGRHFQYIRLESDGNGSYIRTKVSSR